MVCSRSSGPCVLSLSFSLVVPLSIFYSMGLLLLVSYCVSFSVVCVCVCWVCCPFATLFS
jgi:hypothetical protein